MTGKICPMCCGVSSTVLTQQQDGIDPFYAGGLVRCDDCGEVRHFTHWKTPAGHVARERRVSGWLRGQFSEKRYG